MTRDTCRLEVKHFLQNDNSMDAENFYVAMQCRDCGRAVIHHVETGGEFYAGWD